MGTWKWTHTGRGRTCKLILLYTSHLPGKCKIPSSVRYYKVIVTAVSVIIYILSGGLFFFSNRPMVIEKIKTQSFQQNKPQNTSYTTHKKQQQQKKDAHMTHLVIMSFQSLKGAFPQVTSQVAVCLRSMRTVPSCGSQSLHQLLCCPLAVFTG